MSRIDELSLTSATTNSHLKDLPLCADSHYYHSLDPQYPRRAWLRLGRLVLAHLPWRYLGFLGILAGVAQQIAQNYLQHGPAALTPNELSRLFVVRFILDHPAITALAAALYLLLFLILVRLGAWSKRDEQREQTALERRRSGLRLAQGFNAYLKYVQRSAESSGLLWPYTAAGGGGDPSAPVLEEAIFAPLRLSRTRGVTRRTMPLDLRQPIVSLEKGRWEGPNYEISPATPASQHAEGDRDFADALAQSHAGALVVVGQPGTGKTTLLRHIAYERAAALRASALPGGRIPFVLDLSLPDVAARPIRRSILDVIAGNPGVDLDVASRIADELLLGPSLLLVDGLDETVGENRTAAIAMINDLTRVSHQLSMMEHEDAHNADAADSQNLNDGSAFSRSTNVQVVVSSRVASYREGDLDSALFEVWEILPITEPEVQLQLIERIGRAWDKLAPTRNEHARIDALNLLQRLNQQSQTRGWTTNPLLLTLATLDAMRSGAAPPAATRAALYRRSIEALFEQRLRDWTPEERTDAVALAESAALALFVRGQRTINMRDFSATIAPYLPNDLSLKKWHVRLGAADVLLTWSGLFVERALGQYDIYHLTFLEYLAAAAAARQLKQQLRGHADLEEIVRVARAGDGHMPIAAVAPLERPMVAVLWTERTNARWNNMFGLFTGILCDVEDVNRPNLALGWVRALLDQPRDVGLLCLRLAASCAAELPQVNPTTTALCHDIAEKLMQALAGCAVARKVTRMKALARGLQALAASETGRGVVVPQLIDGLSSMNPEVRMATADAAGTCGVSSPELLESLLQLLHDGIPRVRAAAAHALGGMGAQAYDAIPLLYEKLTNPREHREVRGAAARSIRQLIGSSASLSPLTEYLEHTIPSVREAAAEALRNLGTLAQPSVPALRKRLGDTDWRVRATAARALGAIGLADAATLTALSDTLLDAQEEVVVRSASAEALGKLGTPTEPVVSTLSQLLSSSPLRVRSAAALALRRLGPNAVEHAFTALAQAMGSKDATVRRRAAHSVGLLATSDDRLVHMLVALLTDAKPTIRASAAESLAALGLNAIPALPALRTLVKDPDATARHAAIRALRKIGQREPETLTALHASLDDSAINVQAAATRALGTLGLGDPTILTELDHLLTSGHWQVRKAAVQSLAPWLVDASPLVPALAFRLNDPDWRVRTASAETLGRLGTTGAPAPRQLIARLADLDDNVRAAARDAIPATVGERVLSPTEMHELLDDPEDRKRVLKSVRDALRKSGLLLQVPGLAAVPTTPLPRAVPADSEDEAHDEAALTQESQALTRDLLADLDPSMRSNAIRRLRAGGPLAVARAAADIQARLVDPDATVRAAAARAMKTLGTAGLAAAPALLERLRDPDAAVRATAVGALGAMMAGRERAAMHILPKIIELQGDRQVNVRQAVAIVLQSLGETAYTGRLAVLRRRLLSTSWRMRARAAEGIALKGAAGVAAQEELIRCLSDLSGAVRAAAARALGAQGELARVAVPELVNLSRDPNAYVRVAAIEALATIGANAPMTTPALVAGMSDHSPNVRAAALHTASTLAIVDDSLLASIEHAIADEDAVVRPAAALALASLGSQQFLELAQTLENTSATGATEFPLSPFLQRRELDLYRALGPRARVYIPRIVELLDAEHPSVRLRACRALGQLRLVPSTAIEALERCWQGDASPWVRDVADVALEDILSLDPDLAEAEESPEVFAASRSLR